MQSDNVVPLNQLLEEKYGRAICYPKYDIEELKRRLEDLKKLGVVSLAFSGEKSVFGTPVLGKGCVGIVVTAHTANGRAALKIRRLDADRLSMFHEAEMLIKANDLGVGPKFINVTSDLLLMSLVEGTPFFRWVDTLKGRGTRLRLRRVLRQIVEQCYRLDQGCLDHGELSNAPKHIIVDSNDVPLLLDFETASTDRRVSNVTSVSQYIFLKSKTAKKIKRKLGGIPEKELVEGLKAYKKNGMRENFEKILKLCNLAAVENLKTASKID